MSVEEQIREEICMLGRSLFDRGLTWGDNGNITAKLPDGTILATPLGATFRDLDPQHLSKLNAAFIHIGGEKPTSEAQLHSPFYATRPETGAVVHLHSTHAVALSILPDTDHDDALPALSVYSLLRLGAVKILPYFVPGDPAIEQALRALGGERAAVILANHGPIVSGYDLPGAVYAMEELEEAARLALLTRGQYPHAITEDQIAELHDIYQIP